MSDHEGLAPRAVYDHEVEDPRLTGRRRTVADWGVGEEIFDHLPRRRFRPSDTARRDAHRPPRPERRESDEPREPRMRDEPRQRVEPRERPVRDDPRERDEPRAVEPQPVLEPRFVEPSEVVEAPAPVEAPPAADPVAAAPSGRRTVVIRGHGAEPVWTSRRPRPPRTVGERVGPRPDRLAAWAVALGMLLILIAILTAHG